MASWKLMSSSSDLSLNLSSRASTNFESSSSSSSNGGDNFAPEYPERNSGPEQGRRPGLETESSSIGGGEFEPRRGVRKKSEMQQPKEELMTLEDFLAKASEAEEAATKGLFEVKEERKYEVEVVEGRGKMKRGFSLMEPLDKVAQKMNRRIIKNRESAARSRERKQAHQVELELMVAGLEKENEQLLKEKEEQKRKRLKQLMENVVPVVEKRRPPRLQRIRSMQW